MKRYLAIFAFLLFTASCMGENGPCGTEGVLLACPTGLQGRCSEGMQRCEANGDWGPCVETFSPGSIPEICTNTVDDDCDGKTPATDEDCSGTSTTCADGLKNGYETDIDCGGNCPATCPTGQGCVAHADCASNSCDPILKTCTAGKTGTKMDCTGPDGGLIAHTQAKTYFQTKISESCAAVSEQRVCNDGVLSGSYVEPFCAPGAQSYTVSPATTLDLGYNHLSTPSKNITITNTGTGSVTVTFTVTASHGGRNLVEVATSTGSWGTSITHTVEAGQTSHVALRVKADNYPKFFGQPQDPDNGGKYVTVSGEGQTLNLSLKGGYTTDKPSLFYHHLYEQFLNRLPDTAGFDYWYNDGATSYGERTMTFYSAIDCALEGGACIKTTTCEDQTKRIFMAFFQRADTYWHNTCTPPSSWTTASFETRASTLGGFPEFETTWGSW